MSIKNSFKNLLPLTEVIASNPQMLRVNPSILRFLNNYMGKFQIRRVDSQLILHSHLPPLNSRAYARFVQEHLLAKTPGPSHGQIGLTNACPQNCACCYNKNRQGKVMDKETIIKTAGDLKKMGVVWLGLTGGEPLLNKDIIEITERISEGCAIKLFTTGSTLTGKLAADLKKAGVFSVSVSLDHWEESTHDAGRRYAGAFREALKAIDIFKNLGMDVGVSAVLSREMIRNNQTEDFLRFLMGLEINEAWLSEVKPSTESYRNPEMVISEEDRLKLVNLQDKYNRQGKMTVNYLGHFEGKECFGCNAGHKMVYIDAFGDVSPCVFTPMRFGNVQEEPIKAVFSEMKTRFPSESVCFINKNYRLIQKYAAGQPVLNKTNTLKMMEEVKFTPLSHFSELYYRQKTGQPATGRQKMANKPVEEI
ncbi:MAG: radical SAM protein [Dehalococcoidales bacterium]|nr:radical SAM protein [Dehalococcoidales bacterium]